MRGSGLAVQGLTMAACIVAVGACGGPTTDPVKRGEYLAATSACGDCHTPGSALGNPAMDKKFSGGDVGFQMPTGAFYPPNLTPDEETGLGKWTEDQIATAIRTGVRPDGRIIAEVMPWKFWYSQFTAEDATAIAKYLKSLAPIANKVPGPFGPSEKPTGAYFQIVMPEGSPPGAQPLPTAPGTTAPMAPTEAQPTQPPAQPTKPQ